MDLALREMAALVPSFLPGVDVTNIEIKVSEIAQASPLREMFFVALLVTYQKGLEDEVPDAITAVTGYLIPESMDTLVTFITLTALFYGVGAIKTLVLGRPEGEAIRLLDRLIAELAQMTGLTGEQVRQRFDDRYREKKPWRRLRTAVKGVFQPSKRQDSAAIQFNGQVLQRDVVRDIPADFIVDHAEEHAPTRYFKEVSLEIHAQDKDHGGKGWAAIIPTVADRRIPLRLMTGVEAKDLWGADTVKGDVTVIYDRVADGIVPKAIHLHRAWT